MTGYPKKFEENNITIISLRVKDKKLLKNQIWEKIESLMSIDFVYGDGDKYIKTKIKIYKDSLFRNFHNKKILSIIILDSAIKTYGGYHPQTFLECKYEKEKIKTKNYINENLKSDSDPGNEAESDTDTDTNDNE